MRIGIDISVLNDRERTGIGVYTFELLRSLLKINQKDQFILFGISTLTTYNYLQNLEFKDYPNVRMKIYRMPAKAFRIAFLLWQKLNWPPIEYFIGPVDIFHSFNWFLPPQKSGKSVATVFDLTSVLFPGWHDSRTTQMDQMRFNRMAKQADLVIAISESTKKDWLKFYPRSRAEVIYPGCKDVLKKVSRGDGVLKKYGLKPGYLLSVGTLEPRKNLINLLKAYGALLASPVSDVASCKQAEGGRKGLAAGLPVLVLVGKRGWKNEELIKLINQYPGRIKVLGFVPDEDLRVLYQQAGVFIYLSFYEGFGIPVLEAMSFGCPVITSDTSSLPEVGGRAVKYVNPGNLEEIGKVMGEIWKSGKIREKMKAAGLKQAKNFSWEISAGKLNGFYQMLGKKE